jgi:hypothetical protein
VVVVGRGSGSRCVFLLVIQAIHTL